jgi:hypothetical protein
VEEGSGNGSKRLALEKTVSADVSAETKQKTLAREGEGLKRKLTEGSGPRA